jgi:hypothetical protein
MGCCRGAIKLESQPTAQAEAMLVTPDRVFDDKKLAPQGAERLVSLRLQRTDRDPGKL